MPNYYNPDLTGIDSGHNVAEDIRTIFKDSQVVKFDSPVFDNDLLIIQKLGINPIPLVKGQDYTILSENKDYDMMSRMKTIDSSFDKTLISSITMIKLYEEQYNISMSYNRLFPDSVSYSVINGVPPIESDDVEKVLASVVEQLNYLNAVVKNGIGDFPIEETGNLILDQDINGSNPINGITDEEHYINTHSDDISLINPVYGSFFEDSVSIKDSSGTLLVKGEDYDIFGLDLVKTELTSNTSGVYNYIKIIKDMIGIVKVTYHAFGGSLTIDNLKALEKDIISVKQFLINTTLLSASTIKNDQTILGLKNKITTLEDNMRILLNGGVPTYGDATNGIAIRKKINSTDSNQHWWTIAELYKVDGSPETINADSMRLRVQLSNYNIQFECGIAFNANNDDNPFAINCILGNINKDTFYKCVPRMRLIYMNIPQAYSGVLLQIGMRIDTGISFEIVGVEDLSGKESCWKLVSVDSNTVGPEDDGIKLPDGTLYNASSPNAVSLIEPINIPDGYNLDIATDPNDFIELIVQTNPITISGKIINPFYYLSMEEVLKIKSITVELLVNTNKTYYIDIPVYVTDGIYANTTFKIGTKEYEINIFHPLPTGTQYSDVEFTTKQINSTNPDAFSLVRYNVKF